MAEKFLKRKKALESKGLKVNINKTKAMKIRAKSCKDVANDFIVSCGICGKRMMRNSVQYQKCEY